MREQNGLCMLHVGHASHRNSKMGAGFVDQRGEQPGRESRAHRTARSDHEKAKIGCDQFVAAAAGVELPPEGPEFLDQRLFDEMMNVFGGGAELIDPDGVAFCAVGDLVERRERLPNLGFGKNAGVLQGTRPGTVDCDLVGQKPAVKGKRALEGIEMRVRCRFEASTPETIVFAFGHGGPRKSSCGHRSRRCQSEESGSDGAHRAAAPLRLTQELWPSAFALGRTVTGKANKLIKPSASFGLYRPIVKLARSARYRE